MEYEWYCPQKGKENGSKDWKTPCKICCSVCQNKCYDPPCSIPVNQLCCWRRTITEMMMEKIIPDVPSCYQGITPHEYYYQLRRYEWYKRKGHKAEDCKNMSPEDEKWEAQFIRNFENKYLKKKIKDFKWTGIEWIQS